MKKLSWTAALLTLLLAPSAQADRRNFVFLYEPRTMPQGEMELEYYMTASIREDWLAKTHVFGWNHQVELEYGITDRWDVSMYQTFSSSGWTGYKLRTRYRPFDPGALPVEVLGYLELIGRADGSFGLEEKIVIGKSFGKLSLSLDTTFEQIPLGRDAEFEWGEALGISYEFAPWVSLGLETQAKMGWEPRQQYTSEAKVLAFKGPAIFTGPTLSLATEKFWWNVNLSARASGDRQDPAYLFRVLWGVFL